MTPRPRDHDHLLLGDLDHLVHHAHGLLLQVHYASRPRAARTVAMALHLVVRQHRDELCLRDVRREEAFRLVQPALQVVRHVPRPIRYASRPVLTPTLRRVRQTVERLVVFAPHGVGTTVQRARHAYSTTS